MRRRPLTFFLLAASAAPALSGDVTIRSHNALRFGAVMPGPVAQRTRNGTDSPLPETTVRYRKGGREYLKSGKFACLMDFDKRKITILDSEHKKFATVAMKDYAARLAAALPALPSEYRSAQKSAKVTVSSRTTGRIDTIQGVPVEETEISASLELPVPTADGKMQAEPLVKMALQVWTAKSAEALRVPAVRELMAHNWPDSGFSPWIDPGNILTTIFGAMPGLGDGLTRMFQEVEKSHPVVLKTHLEASMPGMAAFLRQMRQQQGQAVRDDVDVNAPFSVVDSEVVELSTAPVEGAIFQVPADYRAAPFDEVVKSVAPDFPKS